MNGASAWCCAYLERILCCGTTTTSTTEALPQPQPQTQTDAVPVVVSALAERLARDDCNPPPSLRTVKDYLETETEYLATFRQSVLRRAYVIIDRCESLPAIIRGLVKTGIVDTFLCQIVNHITTEDILTVLRDVMTTQTNNEKMTPIKKRPRRTEEE